MAEAFDYWILGIQYLRLAEVTSAELVKNENVHGVVFSGPVNWDEYLEITKWSDHSIGIAIIFNFFHGIELIMKGFLAWCGDVPKHHRLTEILSAFEEKYAGTALGTLIQEHTSALDPTSPLGAFFAANSLSVDKWYDALKYPESPGGFTYTHTALQYGGSKTLEFWQSINEKAFLIRREAVSLSRSLE